MPPISKASLFIMPRIERLEQGNADTCEETHCGILTHPRTTVGGASEMVGDCCHVENSEGPDPSELFITR